MPRKFAEQLMDWLVELGYTHCFFVAGGNIMHLLDGARSRMKCVPVVHEMAAGVAVEYFNESNGTGRAFALVTAGPGLTNIVSAVAGAWLESRELLVIGGQVKSTDLAGESLRQRGIQEIDGAAIVRPITKRSETLTHPVERGRFVELVAEGRRDRCGPVFIEVCLDAQGAPVDTTGDQSAPFVAGPSAGAIQTARDAAPEVADRLRRAERPLLLLGGGVSRSTANECLPRLTAAGIPLMTTWNGADRVPADHPLYFGRPNTWGQRHANVLLAQADLVVALGTRLGLQQTGFNWQEFGRSGQVVQVDIDQHELDKGHPRVDLAIPGDADTLLRSLATERFPERGDWLEFCRSVRDTLPLREDANRTGEGFICPYRFYLSLSDLSRPSDIVIPCSSGGANSVAMQAYQQRSGQVVITDKGLASMGYGLPGAIGAALAHPDRRVLLVEGDGGFAQNLQELATVAVNRLDLKIFIFANDGYASIRTTQRNYFGGAYLGCDTRTGLGFPDWLPLFRSFGIPAMNLAQGWEEHDAVVRALDAPGPHGFIVPIDPEQTYWPKITSRINASGGMESQPLHLMTPELHPEVASRVFRYLR